MPGLGPRRRAGRIRRTAGSLMRVGAGRSSPCTLRYPQAGGLPRQPQHQGVDVLAGRRTVRPVRGVHLRVISLGETSTCPA